MHRQRGMDVIVGETARRGCGNEDGIRMWSAMN